MVLVSGGISREGYIQLEKLLGALVWRDGRQASAGRYGTLLHGVTGTCLALVHTEDSALQDSGRNSDQRGRHPSSSRRRSVGQAGRLNSSTS